MIALTEHYIRTVAAQHRPPEYVEQMRAIAARIAGDVWYFDTKGEGWRDMVARYADCQRPTIPRTITAPDTDGAGGGCAGCGGTSLVNLAGDPKKMEEALRE